MVRFSVSKVDLDGVALQRNGLWQASCRILESFSDVLGDRNAWVAGRRDSGIGANQRDPAAGALDQLAGV